MFSGVSAEKSKAPSVVLLTRTPSISTSVWSVSAPRMKTFVTEPRDPLSTTSTPGTSRSASATVVTCLRSRSSPVITVTAGAVVEIGCSESVGVTTIVPMCSSAAGFSASSAHAAALSAAINSATPPTWIRFMIPPRVYRPEHPA